MTLLRSLIRRFSLFTYLAAGMFLCSSFVLGLVVWRNNTLAAKALFEAQDDKFEAVIRSSMEDINHYLRNVEEAVAENVLSLYELEQRDQENAERMIIRTLEAHPSIFGMEIIFSPDGLKRNPGQKFTTAYAWRNGEKIQREERVVANDYQADWFRIPSAKKTPVWSEPYVDQMGVTMVTYSIPVIANDGSVDAVFTADLSIEWIWRILHSLPVGKSGEPILFSANQTVTFFSNKEGSNRETLSSLAAKATNEWDRKEFTELSKLIRKNEFGRFHYSRFDQESQSEQWAWLYFRTNKKNGWTIGCIIPEKMVTNVVNQMSFRGFLFGLGGVILLVIPSWLIARSVSKPLRGLIRAAEDIAAGNFETPLPEADGSDEIARLIGAVDFMRQDLIRYINDVTESTRTNERIASQLAVAHSIQLGMVPKDFSSARNRGVDLSAMMKPAQEVGGDLYDFAMLDNDHLYFCIGDVSGKGIPASLFMAVGKTLLRSTMKSIRDPATALRLVNDELVVNNDGGLFITALCGIFDRKSGGIVFACAGHNPPAVLHRNGEVRWMEVKAQFPLAIDEGTEYRNQTFRLDRGDVLFLYTDGVTDAEDIHGNFFGNARLLSELKKRTHSPVEELVPEMMKTVGDYASGAKQSDDITLLAFAVGAGGAIIQPLDDISEEVEM